MEEEYEESNFEIQFVKRLKVTAKDEDEAVEIASAIFRDALDEGASDFEISCSMTT
jgi:type II secretory ATPase GspE/PulE/Tfp pilus assembly ATPase PilB-like protein